MRAAMGLMLVMGAGCADANADGQNATYAGAVHEVGYTDGPCGAPLVFEEMPPFYTVESCLEDSCEPAYYYTRSSDWSVNVPECHVDHPDAVIRVRWAR